MNKAKRNKTVKREATAMKETKFIKELLLFILLTQLFFLKFVFLNLQLF